MRRTLYLKFLVGYLLFGIFGFIVVATFVSNMTYEHCRRDKAENLYAEATQIADTYAADLYNSETSLETVRKQILALSKYMDDAVIWIINPSGRLVLDSTRDLTIETEVIIEGFDPTVTAGSYYVTGNFFGSFNQDMLSVIAPITANYKVQGYVVIHMPLSAIQEESNDLLNISYIMLIIIFLLSLTEYCISAY